MPYRIVIACAEELYLSHGTTNGKVSKRSENKKRTG